MRGRLGRDGSKVHCGTVLRDAFSTLRQIRPPKQSKGALLTTISTWSLAQPRGGEYSMHTNETFRTNEERCDTPE